MAQAGVPILLRRAPILKVELLRVRAARTEVAVLAYEPRRARGVSLVAGHGYSSSKHNLDFLCAFLASHGYGVYSLDFPGHKLGASGGRLAREADLVDAMSAVVEHAMQHGAGQLYTLGHSMGALTALRVAAQDERVVGVVSIATGYGRAAAIDSLKGKVTVDFRSSYVDGLTLPDLMVNADRLLDEALVGLAGKSALYVAADHDLMVSLASARELFERAPEAKRFVQIQSDHTSAADHARAPVLEWLNQRHARAEAS